MTDAIGDLDRRLLAAHRAGALPALIALYTEAADSIADPQACGFYLTHAYVFALEAGAPEAAILQARLAAQGRV